MLRVQPQRSLGLGFAPPLLYPPHQKALGSFATSGRNEGESALILRRPTVSAHVLQLCFVVALGLVSTAGCVPLHPYTFMAEVEAVQSELDGTIRFSDPLLPGTEIDVVEVLDVDDEETIVAYRGAFNLGPVTIEGEYAKAEYEGSTTLSETITFLGQTFTVNADVDSKLSGTIAGAKARFGMLGVGSQDGKPGLVLGGTVGLQYMELTAEIVSTSPVQLTEEDTERVVFPVLGLILRLDQPLGGNAMFFLEGDANGMTVSDSDADGTYIDATARIGVIFDEIFTVGGGYRVRSVDFEIDDDDVDVEIAGPFIFAGLRF